MSIQRRVSQMPSGAPAAETLAAIIVAQRDIMALGTDLDAVMHLAAERTRALTNAHGAAVELAEGDFMVYRVATGAAASFVGLRLRREGSMSGLCVATGEILSCDDSEEDPRVDREACRKVGARSLVVVPLRHGQQVVGVLKVMSPVAAAFDEHDVDALQLIAGLIAAAISNAAADDARRVALERFRSITQATSDAIFVIDAAGVLTFCNDGALRLFGYGPNELEGGLLTRLMPERYRAPHARAMASFNPNKHSRIVGQTIELHGLRKDGSEFPLELSVATWQVDNARFFAGIARDTTERKRSEEARMWLASIVESSEDAIIGRSLDGSILSWNAAAERLTGYTAKEVANGVPESWIPADRVAEAEAYMEGVRRGEAIGHFETVRRRKSGELIDVSIVVSPVRNADGVVVGAALVARDITERKRLETRVLELARTDLLTGLLLRRAGDEALAQAHQHARQMHEPMSVALLDLDHFKRINDELGHGAGDDVLRTVGAFVRESLRPQDIASRWGGEELLIASVAPLAELVSLVEGVRERVAALPIAGVDCVTLSAGVAEIGEGEHVERAIARADSALYVAKRSGRNRVQAAPFVSIPPAGVPSYRSDGGVAAQLISKRRDLV